jgi:hypothetical protein
MCEHFQGQSLHEISMQIPSRISSEDCKEKCRCGKGKRSAAAVVALSTKFMMRPTQLSAGSKQDERSFGAMRCEKKRREKVGVHLPLVR